MSFTKTQRKQHYLEGQANYHSGCTVLRSVQRASEMEKIHNQEQKLKQMKCPRSVLVFAFSCPTMVADP